MLMYTCIRIRLFLNIFSEERWRVASYAVLNRKSDTCLSVIVA